MEMESQSDDPRRRLSDLSERISDTADRFVDAAHEADAKTRTTAQDIKALNAEYFNDIDLHLIDLAKIPSLITLLGMVLTAMAIGDLRKAKNLKLLAAGFIADNADGLAAKIFDQESDAGALFDASADKLKIAATGIAAWQQNAVPKPALVGLGAIEMSHIGLTAWAKLKHNKASFRPPKAAKYAMASRNAGVASHLVSEHLLDENPESKKGKYLHRAALGFAALSVCLEVSAQKTYFNRTRENGIIDNHEHASNATNKS